MSAYEMVLAVYVMLLQQQLTCMRTHLQGLLALLVWG
jgi:hypothetical protein